MSTLLEARNLKKYFKVSSGMLHAVDDVTFTIEKGKTIGVVGESGCGKTTLGRVLIHLLDSTSGQIIFEGKDITNISGRELRDIRKKMQIIFQDPFSSLNPRMTIYQTIAEPLEIEGGLSSADIQKRVFEMMDTVGLARRFVNTYPHELDGGRRQRVGIARALALRPEFIVCDEPVSALDVSIQAQILNLMQDIQSQTGLTFLFITHDLSVVKYISDDILVMYLGEVVEAASSDQLFAKPTHPYTKALLSAVPIPQLRAKKHRILLSGELSSPINPKPGCRFASRCPNAKDICFTQSPQSVEIESGHTVRCHCVDE